MDTFFIVITDTILRAVRRTLVFAQNKTGAQTKYRV